MLAPRGRVPRRRRLVSRLSPLVLVVGLLAVLPTTAAPAYAATYTRTASADLAPGRAAESSGPTQSFGYLKIPNPGTYFATLTARITDHSVDPVQVASISLLCKEERSSEDKIGTSANVVRGETFTLSTRFYFTIKKRGACFAYGSSTGLKASSASPSSRSVRANATLVVTGPVSDATRESKRFVYDDANRGYSGSSFLSKPKVQTHASELETSAAPGSTALVTGNLYLTTCISSGGSRDATTDGRKLCTPGVIRQDTNGSVVRVRLVVRQFTRGGSVCATTIVPGSTIQQRISSRRHHLPIDVKGNVTLRDASSGCGYRIRVWTELQVLSGPAVVVHFPNTVTAYRPT